MMITYRLATLDDLDSLIPLRIAMQKEVGHGDDAHWATLESSLRSYFTTNIPSREFVAYVAEVGGRIIATSGIVFHQHPPTGGNVTGREAYIMNMYTVAEFRGQGIAGELLRRLIELARDQGCGRVLLHAQSKAKPLYRKAGFVDVDSEMRLQL
jgi:GNAT superfamily N-acetyltransferase